MPNGPPRFSFFIGVKYSLNDLDIFIWNKWNDMHLRCYDTELSAPTIRFATITVNCEL